MQKPKYLIVDQHIISLVTEDHDFTADENTTLYYTINGGWIYHLDTRIATFIPKHHILAVHVKFEDEPEFNASRGSFAL